MVNDSRLKCKLIKASNQFWKWISIMLKKFHLSLAGIFRPFFVQKNKNIQHINEGRNIYSGNKGVSLSYHEPERRVIIFNLVTSPVKQASYQMHKREDT